MNIINFNILSGNIQNSIGIVLQYQFKLQVLFFKSYDLSSVLDRECFYSQMNMIYVP